VLRLPLALVSAAIVVSRVVLGQRSTRDSSDASPWVIGAPIAFASIVAIVSSTLHDAHADSHATFVGLAAASALAVDILLSRARRDVLLSRVRTTQALDVPARVV